MRRQVTKRIDTGLADAPGDEVNRDVDAVDEDSSDKEGSEAENESDKTSETEYQWREQRWWVCVYIHVSDESADKANFSDCVGVELPDDKKRHNEHDNISHNIQ